MNYTDKILAEFDTKFGDEYNGISKNKNIVKTGTDMAELKAFLTTSIAQALAEDRERVRERMGELTIYRNNKGVTEIEENTGYYKASEITSSLDIPKQ